MAVIPTQICSDYLSRVSSGEACIESAFVSSNESCYGIIYYEVVVVANNSLRWSVQRRFAEFHSLHSKLKEHKETAGTDQELPPFPSRAWGFVVDHFSRHFLDMRKTLLSNFLERLVQSSQYNQNFWLLEFFRPDHSDQPENASTSDTTSLYTSPTCSTLADMGSGTSFVSETEEVTSLSVSSAQILQHDHVVYQINLFNQHKPVEYQHWTVLRRYNDFLALHKNLINYYLSEDVQNKSHNCSQLIDSLPFLPSKLPKVFKDHLDAGFIEERRLVLQLYLRKLICSHHANTPVLLEFLSCH
mmetsp:Transcript_11606/g.22080  ORF Transcript_11606/g.22080 Transcript_11606/m.22080 type:complete len:301 (+) Transcript_11606:40-942(+)